MDTNVIIEAVRTGCWNALCSHFYIETVEKCSEEALTGDRLRPGYVDVDPSQLRKALKGRHAVLDIERAQLALSSPDSTMLDPGERDLFAHALARADKWAVCCADRAALNVALALGWEDRIVSLEVLVRHAGAKRTFKAHYTEAWLSEVRKTFFLERLLK